jgi:Xaa-Pro aminopeptidase
VTTAPAEFHHDRWRRVRALIAAQNLDVLLVSSAPNIAYLTGFFGTAGFVLVSADGGIRLLSDARYQETLALRAQDLPGLETSVVPAGGGSQDELLASQVTRLSPARLGFEAQNFTVRQFRDLERRLLGAGVHPDLVAADSPVEQLRLVKDDWEIETLREAGRRLSDVAKCIIPKALAGISERSVAAAIEAELRRVGFDKPAFDTIVASGPHSAMPHYRAGDRTLETGDLVVLDFGGVFRGYCVDMTRTVVVGSGPAGAGRSGTWERSLQDAVLEAQRAAFAVVHPGAASEDVDAAARDTIARLGMAEAFNHGLGHGLGLEIHERPRLARRREGVTLDSMAPGMVFTLEPGVYFSGRGGARVEDDVLATAGGAEWLTELPSV